MKEGFPDKVYEGVIERLNNDVRYIIDSRKGTLPFRQNPVSPLEKIYAFRNHTQEENMALMQEFGLEAYADYMKYIRELEEKQNA